MRERIFPPLGEEVIRKGGQRVKRAAKVAHWPPQNDLIAASFDFDFVGIKLELPRNSDRLRVAAANYFCRGHGALPSQASRVYTSKGKGDKPHPATKSSASSGMLSRSRQRTYPGGYVWHLGGGGIESGGSEPFPS